MNKILPIILVVVFSGCATNQSISVYDATGEGRYLKDYLQSENQYLRDFGGTIKVSCSALRSCLREKGWVFTRNMGAIVIPPSYLPSCRN